MNGSIKDLLESPPVAAVTFGALSLVSGGDMVVTMASAAGAYLVVYGLKHPPKRVGGVFASDVRATKAPVYMWNDSDGFTHRLASEIQESDWRAVAKDVMTYKHQNLTQDVVWAALPDLTREDARKLHKRMVGLLKQHGVLNKKGTASEIVYPDGLVFFARVDAGHNSVLRKLQAHHRPPKENAPQNAGFTHSARGARGIMNLGEAT